MMPDDVMPPDIPHPADVVSIAARPKRAKVMRARPDRGGGWRERLSLDDDARVRSTLANAALILTHDEEWSGVLGYDEREETPVFLARPPFADCPDHLLRVPRSLIDADEVRVAQWLEERHGLTVPLSQIHAAMTAVATTSPFDRVRDYLDGLAWDGVPRLDLWLHAYLGVQDSAYASAVGAAWMISAVARTYTPGCKADHSIVLEGPQGIGKSTALRVLAGGSDYFGDDVPAVGTKDCQQYLGGLWIIELAEMEAATKAESNLLKRFLTTTVDKYRPSYGRHTLSHPRRCVFAGSVNLDEYLKDPTGGRRFWPVRCGRVDLTALESERDQLWAEAVHRYRAGEPWHLSAEIEAAAKIEQAMRAEIDPWTEAVQAYLTRTPGAFVTTADVLTSGLGMEIARASKADSNRVGAVMRALGWRYGEGPSRQRGWIRP